MYKLYNRLGSAGLAIEAVFHWADIPFELIEIESAAGDPTPESFKKINPWGQLPTLILPNGDTLTETSAILIYLAGAHPNTPIGPEPGTPAHARYVRWIIFSAINIQEAVARRNYPFRFTSNANGYADLANAATQRMGEALSLLDNTIAPGPYLLGDEMSAADIYFAMLFAWNRGAVELPHLQAISDHVATDDTIAPVWKRHIGDRLKNDRSILK